MVIASAAYAVLALGRSWVLLTSGDMVQIALALAIVVVPVLGMALVLREVWFGWHFTDVCNLAFQQITPQCTDGSE